MMEAPVEDRVMVVSSDGHAGAEMDDYRAYLDPGYGDAFDVYAAMYREVAGGRSTDLKAMSRKVSAADLAAWKRDYLDTGRLEGYSDPVRRCAELDRNGVAGELLFPDFGVPFGPFPASVASWTDQDWEWSIDQAVVGFRAYNRWLVDFCAAAPGRLAGQAAIIFQDPGSAVADIHWAKEQGLAGIVFVSSPGDKALYDKEYEPVWTVAEDLELPVNFHVAISSAIPHLPVSANQAAALAQIGSDVMEIAHRVLAALIWGGVLERHPRLKVVFTEQHSDWVIGHLARMNHSYDNSNIKSGLHQICPRRPSEYFERQCYLGSSIFSRGEVRGRAQIGLEKMMIGLDYPHYEGAFRHDTLEYFRATFGAERVPEAEARKMLGETVVSVFGLDAAKLAQTGSQIGPTYAEILAPPQTYEMPGDVLRPLQTVG